MKKLSEALDAAGEPVRIPSPLREGLKAAADAARGMEQREYSMDVAIGILNKRLAALEELNPNHFLIDLLDQRLSTLEKDRHTHPEPQDQPKPSGCRAGMGFGPSGDEGACGQIVDEVDIQVGRLRIAQGERLLLPCALPMGHDGIHSGVPLKPSGWRAREFPATPQMISIRDRSVIEIHPSARRWWRCNACGRTFSVKQDGECFHIADDGKGNPYCPENKGYSEVLQISEAK